MKFFEKEKTETPKIQDPPPELIETDFNCSNCERPLLKTLRTKDVDHFTKVRVHCSECDDFSFTKIQDAETSVDNSLHTIYTKVGDV